MDNIPEQPTQAGPTVCATDTHAGPPRPEPVFAFFGDYTVLGEIASGGMGVVYQARQRKLNRTVALKMIRSGALAREDAVRRFRIEAEAAATLDHPNIVPIYEFGERDGRHYFSMKLVNGGSLDDFNEACARREGSWFRTAPQLVVKIAMAVQHAHDRGILHRDLKPKNILVDEHGEPHVTDFGLAKLLDQTSHETMADAILGTPNYMAPEQASGQTRDVTTAADVYSLGAILFELLVGKAPFHGASVIEILDRVRTAPPPDPCGLNPALPRDLATICLKCLEKEPLQRYPSARALADELSRWLAGEPILARPATAIERFAKWVRRNPRLASALGFAFASALVAVSGITWQWQRAERQNQERQKLNNRLEAQRAEDFLAAGNPATGLATLARVLRDNPANRVASARIVNRLFHHHQLTSISPPLGAGGTLAAFSPDGRVCLTGTNEQGWVVTLSRPGSTAAVMLPHADTRILAVAVSRDGRLAATGLESGVRLWNATDGRLLREWRWNAVVPFVGFRETSAGPELLAASNNMALACSIETGSILRRYDNGTAPILLAERSPDSRRLAVATEDGAVHLHRLEAGQEAQGITISNAHHGVIRSLAYSGDGRLLLSAASDRSARLWKADTGESAFHLPTEESVVHAAFNAAGTLVVLGMRNGMAQIWDALTGQPAAPLLLHPKPVNSTRFSPDGRWVVTTCDDGITRIWSVLDGQLAASTPGAARPSLDAAFHASGQMLLTLADGTSARLWTLLGGAGAEPHNLEAGAAANQLAAGQGDIPAVELSRYAAAHGDVVVFSDVSANGALAATASRDRTARLWHRATGRPVSDPLQHDATVNCVRFSADGATLVTSTSSRKLRLWDTATGQPITDWITSTRPVARVWLSPDNRFVVTSDGEVWSVYGARETGPAWLPSLAEAVAGIRYRGDLNRISEPVPPESLAAVRQQIAGAPVPDRTNWLHSWAIQLLHDSALVGF